MKQNVSKGRKENVSEGEKYYESGLFQLWIMTLIPFSPLIMFDNYKSPHPGLSESVTILGAQMKKTPHKIAI